MPTSVRLDEETERLVRRLARQSRRTRSDVIRDAIRLLARSESQRRGSATLYDEIAHLIGIADSGGAKLSERTGDKFRQLLQDRTRGRRSR